MKNFPIFGTIFPSGSGFSGKISAIFTLDFNYCAQTLVKAETFTLNLSGSSKAGHCWYLVGNFIPEYIP